MFEKLKFRIRQNKQICLAMINLLLFPFVLGHFDDVYCACEFAIVKKNRTAFRLPGNNDWQIHDPNTSCQSVTVLSLKGADWKSFDFQIIKKIFEAEQFTHPLRSAIVESILF